MRALFFMNCFARAMLEKNKLEGNQMATIQLTVEGMSCGHCVASVEKALAGIGASGKVDLAAKQVEVTFPEGTLTRETIALAIEDQGYDVVG